MSMFVDPAGFNPTTVPEMEVSAPFAPMANPDSEEVPALDAYTKRPSGVTAFQQFAVPRVGTLALTTDNVPLACTE